VLTWRKPVADYWDKDGKPLPDVLAWARLSEDRSYAVIEETRLPGFCVLTRWVGIDHDHLGSMFGAPHVPLIFETIVWPAGPLDWITKLWGVWSQWYPTERQAREGHRDGVEWARSHDPGPGRGVLDDHGHREISPGRPGDGEFVQDAGPDATT
jgi:hypothetical protein